MDSKNSLYNTLFKLNYISSILFLIFILALRFFFSRTSADKGFYFGGRGVGVLYISIILTISFIFLTIRYHKKLKKSDK